MPHSQNFDLPYPLASDAPAGSEQLHLLADATDAALTAVDAEAKNNTQTHSNVETRLADAESKVQVLEATLAHAKAFWDSAAYSSYYLRIHFNAMIIPAGRTYKITLTNMKRGETPFNADRNQLLGFSPSQIQLAINGMSSGATAWRPSISNSQTNGVSVYIYAQNQINTKTGRTYYVRMLVVNPAYDANIGGQATPGILSAMSHPDDYPDAIDAGVATETPHGYEIQMPDPVPPVSTGTPQTQPPPVVVP